MADVTHADGADYRPTYLHFANPEQLVNWLSELCLNEAGLSLRAQDRLQAVGYRRVGELLTARVEGVEATLELGFPGRPTVVESVVNEVQKFLESLGFLAKEVAA